MSGIALPDVPEDSFMNKFLLPENRGDYDPEEPQKDLFPEPRVLIHPSPGVCVKTKSETGEKVFINICTSEKIPPPEDIPEERILQLIVEENPNFSIPLSIGQERLESDKGGNECTTYDVVLNKSYFDKCLRNTNFWLFTISVIIEAVSCKYGKVLDGLNFVKLKNRKVMGKIQPQRIVEREMRRPEKDTKKPLIEEISSSNRNESVGERRTGKSTSNKSNYVLLRHPRDGVPDKLIGLFRVPKNYSLKDVSVHASPDRIMISTGKAEFTYDIFVPNTIDDRNTKSILYKDSEVLRVDMPVQN